MFAPYFRAIRTRWLVVVVLGIAGGVGSGVVAAREPAVYLAQTRLNVSFDPGPEQAPPGTRLLMQRRLRIYAGMVHTPRLIEPVISALGLPYTPDQLGRQIRALSPLDSLTIDVTVTDRVAVRAADIANALAAELAALADREEPSAQLPVRTSVAVARQASPPDEPVPARGPVRAAVGALAGLVLGLGVAVLFVHARDGLPPTADLRAVWRSSVVRWVDRRAAGSRPE
jgi:capsular polysaccharide biosynthesis protein